MIAKENRSECPACRLKKCFLLGMKRELIQSYGHGQLYGNWENQLPLVSRIRDRAIQTY